MEIYDKYHILHKGINLFDGYLTLTSVLKDDKTQSELVYIYSDLVSGGTTLCLEVITNEKTVKKLRLPFYKHYASDCYRGDVSFRNRAKRKSGKNSLPCLSIGPGGVHKALKSVVKFWYEQGYSPTHVYFSRETGMGAGSSSKKYKINKGMLS